MTATTELPGLIARICSTHHEFLRAVLPRLDKNLRVLREHPDESARTLWHTVFRTFFNLRMEIEEHLMKEERILFPTIKSLAEHRAPAMGCGVHGPVQQMILEH